MLNSIYHLSELPLSGNKVLVAEDNLMNQKIIKILLEKEALRVTLVSNGLEAVQMLAIQEFMCLILDYQMPEMDGLETLQIVRTGPESRNKQIPVIFLTAELNPDKLALLNDYQVFRVIPKPLQPKALIQAIAEISHQLATPVALPKYNFGYLHTITDGNTNLMIELINIFLEETPKALMEMQQAEAIRDYTGLQKIIHKIRSNYKYLGFEASANLLAALENDVAQSLYPETYYNRIQEINDLTQPNLIVLIQAKKQLEEQH